MPFVFAISIWALLLANIGLVLWPVGALTATLTELDQVLKSPEKDN